ncbi:MAG: hydrogen peroxide-dependent heme synthase [Gemmatimonadota bacterium]
MTILGSQLPPKTLEGWYVLHQLFRLAWPELKRASGAERSRIAEEFAALFEGWADLGDAGWSGLYRVVGGSADALAVHFRPDLEGLGEAERAVSRSGLGDYLSLAYDYVSVVELGLYHLTAELADRQADGVTEEEWRRMLDEAAEAQRSTGFVKRRLYPRQPEDMPYVCFYPMNKRRNPSQNWYRLSLEDRSALMHDHGKVGRRYAGRISQIISGSVGLDDWEWGVTLFGADPLAFKDVVTEMRYDEASAVYAEFGRFYVGKRVRPEEIRRLEI